MKGKSQTIRGFPETFRKDCPKARHFFRTFLLFIRMRVDTLIRH
ncbi:hypothetical protein BDW_08970 [Bdellovibrio bacteriovorus W]|nr:hypothetical protein BDW_08970 [Bdellovibrio bacteriovorus W]